MAPRLSQIAANVTGEWRSYARPPATNLVARHDRRDPSRFSLIGEAAKARLFCNPARCVPALKKAAAAVALQIEH
jgi:hypothetical protein